MNTYTKIMNETDGNQISKIILEDAERMKISRPVEFALGYVCVLLASANRERLESR